MRNAVECSVVADDFMDAPSKHVKSQHVVCSSQGKPWLRQEWHVKMPLPLLTITLE